MRKFGMEFNYVFHFVCISLSFHFNLYFIDFDLNILIWFTSSNQFYVKFVLFRSYQNLSWIIPSISPHYPIIPSYSNVEQDAIQMLNMGNRNKMSMN